MCFREKVFGFEGFFFKYSIYRVCLIFRSSKPEFFLIQAKKNLIIRDLTSKQDVRYMIPTEIQDREIVEGSELEL